MIRRFSLDTGLSDRTQDNRTAITSLALGSSIIEKHFPLYRSGGGLGDSVSLEPAELSALCQAAKTAWEALGQVENGRKSREEGNVQFRRFLHFLKDMKACDVITADCVRSVEPVFGMTPNKLSDLLGERIKLEVQVNNPVIFEFINTTSIK